MSFGKVLRFLAGLGMTAQTLLRLTHQVWTLAIPALVIPAFVLGNWGGNGRMWFTVGGQVPVGVT